MLIYSEPFQKRFEAPLFSCASSVVLSMVAILLIVPFIIGYSLGGFWLKQGVWVEQPNVQFQKDIIVELAGASNTFITWSTRPEYNKYQLSSLRVPTVKSREIDSDRDGLVDWIEFQVSMPMLPSESVQSVRAAFFLDYKLSASTNLSMHSLAIVNEESSMAAGSLHMNGHLKFKQESPVPGWMPRTRYAQSIFNWTAMDEGSEQASTWISLIEKYMDRIERTSFVVEYPLWKSVRGERDAFVLTAKMRIAHDHISYRPGVGELFKWAWVQYFSFMVLVGAIVVPVIGYLVTSQSIATYCSVDRVPHLNGAGYTPLSASKGNLSYSSTK
eukprot:Partr_v1_DN24088_c0_g1_i2_m34574 putative Transmembrane component of the tectonic-like complex, a complex localized at the transition zone of primary cilia and acting as a barrier that prevents diffusion of transmembrane proteins between the cilia and plasma membranes. Required for ciliogenesis and sonic hedgehog SHH signaling